MAMHLASMMHGSGREREVHEHHRQLQLQQQQQHAHYYAQQTQARTYGVPSAVTPQAYATHQQAVEYQYQHHAPQSPPSPPVEEQKPSLPSISSLLTIAADGERASSEPAGQSPKSQQPSPRLRQEQQQQQPQQQHPQQQQQAQQAVIVSHPRMTLPPTPPMHPDPVVDGNQSPSTSSSHSAPYFLGQSLNNVEPHQQRQNGPPASMMKRPSVPSQPSMSPYTAAPYAQSPYASSPGAASAGSYYSPEPHYANAGLYGQRALPSNYQPQMPLPVPTNAANASTVWQHHHYISATSQSAFPQSQDRYICSTCNKAFSRPSSLRIHSHSHTGEKPYKCPQPGCGKAFSVRSNMKRHERGCHASGSTNMTTT